MNNNTDRCPECGLAKDFLSYNHASNCGIGMKVKAQENQCASQATIAVSPFASEHYYPASTHMVSDPQYDHSMYYPGVVVKVNSHKQLSYREQILIDALKKAKKELQVFNMGTQFVDDVVGLFE